MKGRDGVDQFRTIFDDQPFQIVRFHAVFVHRNGDDVDVHELKSLQHIGEMGSSAIMVSRDDRKILAANWIAS